MIGRYCFKGDVEVSKTAVKTVPEFAAMIHRDTARYVGGVDVVEDMSLGCLGCEVTRWEGTYLAGGPVQYDENFVEPTGAVRDISGVDDKVLAGPVGVSPLSSN